MEKSGWNPSYPKLRSDFQVFVPVQQSCCQLSSNPDLGMGQAVTKRQQLSGACTLSTDPANVLEMRHQRQASLPVGGEQPAQGLRPCNGIPIHLDSGQVQRECSSIFCSEGPADALLGIANPEYNLTLLSPLVQNICHTPQGKLGSIQQHVVTPLPHG